MINFIANNTVLSCIIAMLAVIDLEIVASRTGGAFRDIVGSSIFGLFTLCGIVIIYGMLEHTGLGQGLRTVLSLVAGPALGFLLSLTNGAICVSWLNVRDRIRRRKERR